MRPAAGPGKARLLCPRPQKGAGGKCGRVFPDPERSSSAAPPSQQRGVRPEPRRPRSALGPELRAESRAPGRVRTTTPAAPRATAPRPHRPAQPAEPRPGRGRRSRRECGRAAASGRAAWRPAGRTAAFWATWVGAGAGAGTAGADRAPKQGPPGCSRAGQVRPRTRARRS